MTALPQPPFARPCRCARPLLDGDTCLRCGRSPAILAELPLTEPNARRTVTWTRSGVVRAIRAFAFFRGRPPVVADWKPRMGDDWPSLETVEGLFGSVDAAVDVAVGHPRSVERSA